MNTSTNELIGKIRKIFAEEYGDPQEAWELFFQEQDRRKEVYDYIASHTEEDPEEEYKGWRGLSLEDYYSLLRLIDESNEIHVQILWDYHDGNLSFVEEALREGCVYGPYQNKMEYVEEFYQGEDDTHKWAIMQQMYHDMECGGEVFEVFINGECYIVTPL